MGTQPAQPTESMLTAERRQGEPPGEGQVHSHHKLHSQALPSCLQEDLGQSVAPSPPGLGWGLCGVTA